MKSLFSVIVIAAAFLSELHPASGDGGGGNIESGGLRRKRHLKKTKVVQTTTSANENARRNSNGDGNIMNEEDLAFWTRLLQDDRGKGTELGSLPFVPRPPSPTPPSPTNPIRPTPKPTRRPPIPGVPETPEPTPFPTPAPAEPTETTYSPTPAQVGPDTPCPVNKCGLSSSERRSQILDLLRVISIPDLFDQFGTPQRQALDWIIDDDASQLCPDDNSLIQRYTLAVFYYSTNGDDDWKQCNAPANFADEGSIQEANDACTLTTVNATTIFPNDVRGSNAWLTPDSECLWGGISCYAAGTPNAMKVNVVEFEKNGLSGSLPSEMEELSKMRFFALERGSISGSIPASYGNLKSLLLLDFDFNNLDGTLPSSLWGLTSLRQLDLNDNNLEGTLSSEIGNLKQLRFFQIDNNSMEGGIPSALGDIPNFSLIGLSGNEFEGAMPQEVCGLRPSPLQTLVVDCDIECAIPECCTSCAP